MPRYDYRCTGCGHEFELLQSFHEAGSGTCPVCSGIGQRLFHAVPVIYKGSGFYTTDYGRPKQKTGDNGKDSSDGDKSASESTSKSTDTKSADGEQTSGGSSAVSTESKPDSTAKATKETST